MGCLISFPTLPTKKQSACFPLPGVDACSRLENSEVEGNSFFSLAGNPVNWKITDFRFSESLSWTPTNKSPLQANLTGKMLCCLLYGPWQGEQWKEKQEPGLPPNNPLLWWESSFFFHLPSQKKWRGKVLAREVIPQNWSKNTNYPSCSCLFWGLKFKIRFFLVGFFSKEIEDIS